MSAQVVLISTVSQLLLSSTFSLSHHWLLVYTYRPIHVQQRGTFLRKKTSLYASICICVCACVCACVCSFFKTHPVTLWVRGKVMVNEMLMALTKVRPYRGSMRAHIRTHTHTHTHTHIYIYIYVCVCARCFQLLYEYIKKISWNR